MSVVCVIPARLASSRFPRKVLAPIMGKPMIQHVWERAKQSQKIDRLIIACDHLLIFNAAQRFGAEVVLTSTHHSSGTDRIGEVVQNLDCKIIINLQADEPLINPHLLDQLARALLENPYPAVATAVTPILNKSDFINPHCVKVVTDSRGRALYFSRAPIPHQTSKTVEAYKHLGIYAFQKSALMQFLSFAKSPLETLESLEQLRILQAGIAIQTILTYEPCFGVDTPEDLKQIETFYGM
jgi:3-deoxy-manno-octulosonate cytidylyltransferase (CMP-KDO synthetase)